MARPSESVMLTIHDWCPEREQQGRDRANAATAARETQSYHRVTDFVMQDAEVLVAPVAVQVLEPQSATLE